mgnify:CR=1 FL=1
MNSKSNGTPLYRKGHKKPGPGRPKGSKDKTPNALRQAVLDSLAQADPKGAVAFLVKQARKKNNAAFMSLLKQCLPKEVRVDAVHMTLEDLLSGVQEAEAADEAELRRN